LLARTANEYVFPLVRPVAVMLVPETVVFGKSAGDVMTWYERNATPPLELGGLQVSFTCSSPAVALRLLGMLGAVAATAYATPVEHTKAIPAAAMATRERTFIRSPGRLAGGHSTRPNPLAAWRV
jgi:hypothetical protein